MRTEQSLGPVARVAVVGLVVVGAIVAIASRTEVALVWFIAFAGVGALLVIRRPRTSIGWILLGLGWALTIVSVRVPGTAEQFANATFDMPGDLLTVVHNGSIGTLAYLFLLLVIVFPSGQLPTGRWGGLGRAALAVGLVVTVAGCLMPQIHAEIAGVPTSVIVRNPVALLPGLPIWRLITPDSASLPVMLLVVPAALSLVVRTRRSSGVERQQLRWIAASIGFLVLAAAAGFAIVAVVPGAAYGEFAWIPAMIAIQTVPIAIGVAVLRYRLYEIDRLISRGVSWAVLSGLLVAVYVGAVLVLQSVLGRLAVGETLAVAGSTLLAAALFQPLRRRVQAAMDRRFNRTRYDAQRTASAFAGRLRDQLDLDSVVGEMRSAVGSSVEPANVTVWIRARNETRTLGG
jgi:hypothetical protein